MIAIVGGGICGLAIGWRLAEAGAPVTVVERGEAGRGATWAAAGMLATRAEAEPGEEQLLQLLLASQAAWPAFAGDLQRASGLELGYRSEGTLVVALDRDDAERLRFQYDYRRSLGLRIDWLSGARAREREPHLARGATAALGCPDDHQVDNRRLVPALKAALLRAGGQLLEHTPVDEILIEAGRVRGVRLGQRELAAEVVVVAAGCWSRALGGLPEDLRPPVRPVKGQMLALQMQPAAPLIRHVVWGPAVYLVPRDDGRLLVGATVEEMGFDTSQTAGGVLDLLRAAWELLPGIYDLPLVELWAGLRPTSRDDAPILGPTAINGLVMATGHHRNGILLAPVTAESISRLILTGETPEAIGPFGLERFH